MKIKKGYKKLDILFTETNKDSLEQMSELFQMITHVVHSAEDIQSSLDILHNNHIDILITCNSFNNMKGLDLLQHTKEFNSDIYTVLFTGSNAEDLNDICSCDVDFILPKPASIEDIINLLDNGNKNRKRCKHH